MSKLCPENCIAKQECETLKQTASLDAVVKEVTGSKLLGTSNSSGHAIDGYYSVVTVATNNGDRHLDSGELSSIRYLRDERVSSRDTMAARIEDCPGEIELEVKGGELAGATIKMCGANALSQAVQIET